MACQSCFNEEIWLISVPRHDLLQNCLTRSIFYIDKKEKSNSSNTSSFLTTTVFFNDYLVWISLSRLGCLTAQLKLCPELLFSGSVPKGTAASNQPSVWQLSKHPQCPCSLRRGDAPKFRVPAGSWVPLTTDLLDLVPRRLYASGRKISYHG